MAVVTALITEVAAVLSGVQDVMVLKLVAGLVIVTAILNWFAEKRHLTDKTARGAYLLSIITAALPWVLIGGYAVATLVHGIVRSPWYVYALYATTLLATAGYLYNQRRHLKGLQGYEVTERNYLQLGIFAKVAFAVVLIVGLYK